jgi:hypothetical protein
MSKRQAALPVPTLDDVLSSLRGDDGRPNARVKLLALLVALALGGPLTVFVLRLLGDVVGALY